MSDNSWYDSAKSQLDTDQATQIRNNLQFSLDANPQREAGLRQLYNATGIPIDSIRENEGSVRTAATLREFDAEGLVKATPRTAELLTDQNNTKLLHDAIPNTQAVENGVGAVALPERSYGQQIAKKIRDIFGVDERENARAWVQYATRQAGVSKDDAIQAVGGMPMLSSDSMVNQFGSKLYHHATLGIVPDVAGDAESLSGGAAGAGGALVGFLAGAPIKIADYLVGKAGISALEHVAGESFAKAIAKDVATSAGKLGIASGAAQLGDAIDSPTLGAGATKIGQAALSGAETGAVYGVAGRLLPGGWAQWPLRLAGVQATLDTAAGKTPFQDLANWDKLTPAQQGDALFNYGLNAFFTMKGAGRVQGGWFHDSAKAEVSKEDMAKLQMVSQVSAASALRERDPAMFKQFVENISADRDVPDLYIDAKNLTDAFAQSGVDMADITKTMPDLARQLGEATVTNGMVRIPMADYATHLAGTEIDAQILPHFRTDPEGMTYHEGQVFYQSQIEQLKAEVAGVVADKVNEGVLQQSKQAVHDQVQSEIMGTGRVREDVASSYAALHASFFETMAAKFDITPEEAYAKMGGARIVAEDLTGNRFGQEGSVNRGGYSPADQTIALLKQADLSTFLHESGHFFLDTYGRVAKMADAPEAIKQDFDTLLRSYGVADGEAWGRMTLDEQRDAHEKFARGFEAYLMEGKAPSVEMATLFARFRSWLLTVYKNLAGLNVELTPEVRGVMDRMLASEETIKAAEAVRGFDPLFKSVEAAGMTPEQWAEYQSLGSDATRQAVLELEGKSIRDMKWLANAKKGALREMQGQADARRKEMQERVTRGVDSEPIEQARRWVKTGETIDEKGNAIKATAGFKLDSEVLKTMFPEGMLARPDLSKLRGLTSKEGMHPDLVAEMFGMPDGHALVRELIDGESRASKIGGLTDRAMLEKHGELSSPEAIERAAEEAIHNDVRARFAATEYKALSKAAGPAALIAKAAKAAAESSISAKVVGALRPKMYAASEARAAKNAEKAMATGDTQAAATEKRAQLLNNRLVKAAMDAQRDVERIAKYVRKFNRDSIRTKLDPDILNQIDGLLVRFDFRQNPPDGPTRKQEQLAQWVDSAKRNGYTPFESADMLNPEVRMHFTGMTVEQMRGFFDTVRSLEHIARERKTIVLDGKRVDVAEIVAELNGKLQARGERFTDAQLADRPRVGIDPAWRVALDRVSSSLRSAVSEFKGQQFKANQYDLHEVLGPWRKFVFDRIFDANYHKLDMLKKLSDTVRVKAAAQLGADWSKTLADVIAHHALLDNSLSYPTPRRLTRGDMIGIARHVGNESNFDKLVKGMRWDGDAVWKFLSANMTERDWRAVQIEWDLLGSHWGEVEAMNRRLGNTSPERIEPRAFSTPYGEMRGGYAPLRYDPIRSKLGVKKSDASAINPGEELFSRDYYRADSTTNGSLNARVAGYHDYLDLGFHSVERALHDTIHDLAYRESLLDVHKIITHPELRSQFLRSYGPEQYRHLQEWLGRLANSQVSDEKASVLANIMGATRRAIVANGIAFRISTMQKHGGAAGLKTMGYFSGGGEKYILSRMAAIGTNHTAEVASAMSKFPEIRARALQQDRDYKQVVASLYEPESLHGKAERFGHAGVAWLDFLTAVPTAWAAYDRAITEGIPVNRGGTGRPMGEAEAVAYADSIVREAHGSNIESSRSMLMSNPSELIKSLTLLHGFMNNTLGQHLDMVDKLKTAGFSKPEVLSRYLMAMLVPAIWVGWLGGAFDHDSEPWYVAAAKSISGEYSAMVPMVRDAYHAVEGYRSAGLPPWMSALGAVAKPVHDIYDLTQGKEIEHPIKDLGNAFGLGFPGLGQIGSTTQFLTDVAAGKAHPEGAADWVHGLSHGDLKKH